MSNPTRWVGVDLHRRRSQIAIVDEDGQLALSRRIVNDPGTFRELLGDPDGTHVALEATYGWEWLAELLQEAGYDVHLAHPLRTRAIARNGATCVDDPAQPHLRRRVAPPHRGPATCFGQPGMPRSYGSTIALVFSPAGDPAFASVTKGLSGSGQRRNP